MKLSHKCMFTALLLSSTTAVMAEPLITVNVPMNLSLMQDETRGIRLTCRLNDSSGQTVKTGVATQAITEEHKTESPPRFNKRLVFGPGETYELSHAEASRVASVNCQADACASYGAFTGYSGCVSISENQTNPVGRVRSITNPVQYRELVQAQ